MERFGDKVFELVEIWEIVDGIGALRTEFPNSSLILTDSNLLISSKKDDGDFFKVFQLTEIAAFKIKHNKNNIKSNKNDS